MGISWPVYLIALAIVVLGLMALEAVSPRTAGLLVLATVLSVAVVHPTFTSELAALTKRVRGG